MAACAGSFDVCEYLLKQGANVNTADFEGSTPLHDACSFSFLDLIELFLKHGAQVNLQTSSEETPLFCAAQVDNPLSVSKLASHGADVNRPNDHGTSPLFESAIRNYLRTTWTLLDIGASLNSIESEKFVNGIVGKNAYESIDYTQLLQLLLQAGYHVKRVWLRNIRNNTVFIQQCSSLKLLEEHASGFHSLQACCLFSIRRTIAKPISDNVKLLSIPVKLQNFILLYDFRLLEPAM